MLLFPSSEEKSFSRIVLKLLNEEEEEEVNEWRGERDEENKRNIARKTELYLLERSIIPVFKKWDIALKMQKQIYRREKKYTKKERCLNVYLKKREKKAIRIRNNS